MSKRKQHSQRRPAVSRRLIEKRPERSRGVLSGRGWGSMLLVLAAAALVWSVFFFRAQNPAPEPATNSSMAGASLNASSTITPGSSISRSNQPASSRADDLPWTPEATPSRLQAMSTENQIAHLKQEELRLAQRLVNDFPQSEKVLVLLGNTHRAQGQSALAGEAWQRALAMNPALPDVHDGLGQVAYDKGRHAEAVSHWRKLLEIAPDTPRIRSKVAHACLAQGDYSEAVKVLKTETALTPSSDLSYFLLGQAYLRLKDLENARACYERSLELNPKNANAYHGLITVYGRLQQPDKAQSCLARFQQLKAAEIEVQRQENRAYQDLKQMRQRLVEFYVKAESFYRQSGEWNRGKQLLLRAVALAPENLLAGRALAEHFQLQNQFSEALTLLKDILQREPQDIPTWLNFGLVSGQLQQYADAEKAFGQVIAINPQSSAGYRELAKLYLRMGRERVQARELAKKAAQLEPQAENLFALSWALDKNGQTTEALAIMNRALELDPDNPTYQQIRRDLQQRGQTQKGN